MHPEVADREFSIQLHPHAMIEQYPHTLCRHHSDILTSCFSIWFLFPPQGFLKVLVMPLYEVCDKVLDGVSVPKQQLHETLGFWSSELAESV